ncbi:MAG: hypothetical protein P8X74_09755 [Reinekea sp.]
MREDKRGTIHGQTPPILQRLNINPKNWIYSTQHFESSFKTFAGKWESVKRVCAQFGYRRRPSMDFCLT